MTNPYRAPEAALGRESQPPGRPAWVWIICIFYGLGVVSTAITTPLLMSGALPVPEAQGEQLENFGVFGWGMILVNTVLMAALVVQLFRLRASAVPLCQALLALSLANAAWQMWVTGLPRGLEGLSLVSTAFGVGLLVAVLLYAVRLRRRGVLR